MEIIILSVVLVVALALIARDQFLISDLKQEVDWLNDEIDTEIAEQKVYRELWVEALDMVHELQDNEKNTKTKSKK